MNDLGDKLISEFTNLGCSLRNAAATYQVYLELCEVRRLFDVKYYFNNVLKRMYITAKNFKSSEPTTYLPICASENISFLQMQRMFDEIGNKNEIIFAIITADSNCCYYQISNGLPTFNTTNPTNSILKTREHHDVQLNLRKVELETNLNVHTLPPLTDDDGSRPAVVGPMSRQWYPNW